MKEEGDWSSKRLRPHHSTTFQSIIPDWASLPPELVQGIADCVLSTTGGVDAYMDMRAVCHSWHFAIPSLRSAIAKASPLSAVTDLRFRPRNWVMVDLKSGNHDNDDARLFLHALTGCFHRLRLPLLRDHLVLGASDGLIVLRDRGPPDLPRVLNPLTGDMLHFAAPLWEHLGSADAEDDMYTAITGGPNPTLAVWRDLEWRWHTVIYAHPTSQEFKEEEAETTMTTMVTFQGNIYYADFKGWVFEFVPPAEQCDVQFVVIAQMPLHMDIYLETDDTASSYLVESTGELLLVRHCGQTLKVFRVDVKHKLLEEVKSIGGSRALFLGGDRCVSVDSDKLPSVDGDCIYMYRRRAMRMYNLRDGTMEIISNEPRLLADNHPVQSFHGNPWFYHTSTSTADDHHLGPLSLIQGMLLRKDLYTKSGLTGLLMDGGGS